MNPIGMNPHSTRTRERFARYARRVRAYAKGRKQMSKWEIKEDSEVSWWHCDRAGYWEGQDVYCSKCQTKLEEVA